MVNTTSKGKAAASSSQGTKRGRAQNPPKEKKGQTSGKGKHPAVVIPPATKRTTTPRLSEEGAEWYARFDTSKGYTHERAISRAPLKKNFRDIHDRIVAMGWTSVFEQPGPVNIDLVMEFYACIPNRRIPDSVFFRKRWVPLTASALCRAIGAPDVPVEPLLEFIKRPDYRAIRETLCGANSKAQWARYSGPLRKHRSMSMSNFCREARVWLRLLNARIMPLDHFSEVQRERVCIVYFLMTGQPVNIGYWMLQEIRRVRAGKSTRLSYGNTLTSYLMQLDTDLAYSTDRVLDAPVDPLDISNVMAPASISGHRLTPAEERSAQSTVLAQLYSGKMVASEHFNIDLTRVFIDNPHTPHSRALVGELSQLPADEDENSADRVLTALEDEEEEESLMQGDDNEEEEEAAPAEGAADDEDVLDEDD